MYESVSGNVMLGLFLHPSGAVIASLCSEAVLRFGARYTDGGQSLFQRQKDRFMVNK